MEFWCDGLHQSGEPQTKWPASWLMLICTKTHAYASLLRPFLNEVDATNVDCHSLIVFVLRNMECSCAGA